MRCAICGIRIDSVDEAVEEGWTPYFYDGTHMHDVACPSCSQTRLRQGGDGGLEVKEEFRGRLKYLYRGEPQTHPDDLPIEIWVREEEPAKTN